jgi:hypothetical protein
VHVTPCTSKGLNKWCCSASGDDCCDDAFEIASMGTVLSKSTSITSSASSSTATITESTTKSNDQSSQTAASSGGSSSSNTSKTTAVGAGLGAGLGACLLASIGALIFQRRMYEKRLHDLKSFQASSLSTPMQNTPGMFTQPTELHGNTKPSVFEMDSSRCPNI